jgi:hypothetical protein
MVKYEEQCANSLKMNEPFDESNSMKMHNFETGEKKEDGQEHHQSFQKRNKHANISRSHLKMNAEENEDHIKRDEVGIGRYLTQSIIRPREYQKLISREMHGATFVTVQDHLVSNQILTNIYTKRSDAFFRFVVAGRANCLPTPANAQKMV